MRKKKWRQKCLSICYSCGWNLFMILEHCTHCLTSQRRTKGKNASKTRYRRYRERILTPRWLYRAVQHACWGEPKLCTGSCMCFERNDGCIESLMCKCEAKLSSSVAVPCRFRMHQESGSHFCWKPWSCTIIYNWTSTGRLQIINTRGYLHGVYFRKTQKPTVSTLRAILFNSSLILRNWIWGFWFTTTLIWRVNSGAVFHVWNVSRSTQQMQIHIVVCLLVFTQFYLDAKVSMQHFQNPLNQTNLCLASGNST